ncbi:MAG: lipid-A-disaccharide kinase [Chthonomonadaceae bacterium]|nr:lipid-A-disaccharide kinase [Chthonomonadaceae bacterium]
MADSPESERHDRHAGMEGYLIAVSRGRPGLVPTLLRGLLSALAPVYCTGLELYLLPYYLGIRKRRRLPCPVLCIGNLTTGGTGKTPMTQTVCRLLQGAGKRVVVLSRGYGGKNEYGCAIASDGECVLLTAAESGDEAYLLASTLPGIPVVVGKDRRVTGALAWERFHPDVIVLDDGMQFWQLHRDLDIVLLNACEPFDNGWTFPRGLLREPPSHLRRAGIVVLTNARRAGSDQIAKVARQVAKLAPDRPILTADLAPTGLRPLPGKIDCPVSWLEGRPVAALSALGNPTAFESMLESLGANLVARFRFRDHKKITDEELARACLEATAAGAEAMLTTEKDAVKLAPNRAAMPLLALQVEMQIEGETEFWSVIESVLDS